MSTAVQADTVSSYTLEAEQQKLKQFVSNRLNARDGAGLIDARRRLEDLPILIRSAQISETEQEIEGGRAYLAELRQQQAQAQADLAAYQAEHSAEVAGLNKRLEEIGNNALVLMSEAMSYNGQLEMVTRSIIEARTRLEILGGN